MLTLPNFMKPGWWIQLVDGLLTPRLGFVAGLLVMVGLAVRVGMAPSAGDLAERLPSIVAGGLLPGFVYLWLGKIWDRTAGLVALIVLAFAPNLVDLSIQAHPYLVTPLLMAAALYLLEEALEGPSPLWMVFHAAALCLAVFTGHSGAIFAVAAGVYSLTRLRGMSVVLVWAGGQVTAVVIYLFSPMTGGGAGQFLQGDGESVTAFAASATFGQFEYLFLSRAVAPLALMLCLLAVPLLWTRFRGLVLLFVLPFALTCVAALADLYPYGATKGCVFLAIFVAAGAAVSAAWLLDGRNSIVLGLAVLVVPLWLILSETDPANNARLENDRVIELVETYRGMGQFPSSVRCSDSTHSPVAGGVVTDQASSRRSFLSG